MQAISKMSKKNKQETAFTVYTTTNQQIKNYLNRIQNVITK